MSEESSYSLAKSILDDLENNVESLFQRLSICYKKGLSVSSDILFQIIDSPGLLSPSKVLAIQLLRLNLDDAQEKEEIAGIIGSIRIMFRITEILKEDIEESMKNTSENIPCHTAEILDTLSLIVEKVSDSKKDSIIVPMKETGLFVLANVWNSPHLLKLYSSVFSGKLQYERDAEKVGKNESMPYRALIEESIYDRSTILVHRRSPAYFMPKYFKISSEVEDRTVYAKIFAFQDEYSIVHKLLVNWCDRCGDLRGVEWVCAWHFKNLSDKVDNLSYEKEIAFALSAMVYSAIQNTLIVESLEALNMFKGYLELIRRCKAEGSPLAKGSASVASQRLTSQSAKYFINVILSVKTTKKQKSVSLMSLRFLCDILTDSDLIGVRKLVEKHAGRILELVEIEPEESVTLHCTSILMLLSLLERIPLCLFSPSKMTLVLWVVEHGRIAEKQARKWIDQYLHELPEVFNPLEDNAVFRALCL